MTYYEALAENFPNYSEVDAKYGRVATIREYNMAKIIFVVPMSMSRCLVDGIPKEGIL